MSVPIKRSHLLISAASSGGGKTTFTLGLLRLLRKRGLKVQPFKCGPDYIDPKYHRLACGTETVNLDAFMMSREHIARLYDRYGCEADVSIVEGVMGFFDGYDRMTGSSALLAENLRIPVLLLIHAGSTAYSVAPILYGFKHFRPGVAPVGVVFNKVGSASHYRYLEEAAADAGVASLGYLPKMKDLEVPSRHLGLSVEDLARYDYLPDRVADAIEKYVDVERLLGLMASDVDPVIEEESFTESSLHGRKCIAMADDEAFNFTYRENIRRLEGRGRVVRFSPLRDNRLPADCDFLYLPGGYPEFYLPALSANESMKRSIRDYIESGGHALAECGGMMYLCDTIRGMDGRDYPMCGVLPETVTMEGMRLHLGYRRMVYKGKELRGHEFHYSSTIGSTPSVAQQYNVRGEAVETPLYRYKNLLAGYTHLYWGEHDDLWTWFD
ncbi:cobyrinate a,c-diamide synthase [Porphyromonas gingivalis]|uniref:cobyrinate a,c-diamide synthase n=1 Tax=Porphyromonas gingivalis TaxID=837 RepID=UPI00097CE013|nr:cobyrinate a,c-diamide synthase [Porphyromonas gingivalis]SJM19628.1 cobyrinic acid a%2Cc-diamide synthase [Porphyromonas gingivalis]